MREAPRRALRKAVVQSNRKLLLLPKLRPNMGDNDMNANEREHDNDRSELELTARRLLYRPPPSWWTGTDDAWRQCVRANFADALGTPRNIECRV